MRRREMLLLLGGALAAARAVGAQQKAIPVIGFLFSSSSPPRNLSDLARDQFHQGLSETGFTEGQNLGSRYRWAEGHYDLFPALAADLVGRKVDLIITAGGTAAALAAKNATSTIPIVFTNVGAPVGAGLVASLARPGGNLTGFANISLELTPKRLDLLSKLVPQARVIALLVNDTNPAYTGPMISAAKRAARAMGLQLDTLKASDEAGIDTAFATLAGLHADGLLVGADPFFNRRRDQLVALASRDAVPTIYGQREYTTAGGLISYGPSLAILDGMDRQAGIYAGRILKGANPADLPVQQPTRFELVVNLNAAKALGLTVPPTLLAGADEVIE